MDFSTNRSSPSAAVVSAPRKLALLVIGSFILLFTLLLVISSWAGVNAKGLQGETPTLPAVNPFPNGAAAGDVDQTSAVLWAHSNFTGVITFTYFIQNSPTVTTVHVVTRMVSDPSVPVTIPVTALQPDTRYAYEVTTTSNEVASGQFETSAPVGASNGLRFGAAGDWSGDLSPYVAIANAPDRALQFFVRLGDTIYADIPSPALPISQATTLAEFRQKHDEGYGWRYDENFWAQLQRRTSIFATIDDHEVIGNFAGGVAASTDTRFPETTGLINDTALYENGLRAFAEFNPIRATFYGVVGGDGRMDNERKLYRYQNFGSDAALFVLDARSFRDGAIAPLDVTDLENDLPRFLIETYGAGRTLLGSQQLQDLKADLWDAQQKGIVWKFVALPEPIQLLSPAGAEDRYEGYAAERTDLLRFIADNQINNVVFVAADIHGTVVNNLTYQDSPFGAAHHTGAFEVTTGAVAHDAPFGPTIVDLALQAGFITPTTKLLYDTLPVVSDLDSVVNDKDDFVKTYLNQQLDLLSYDSVGLEDAAELPAGQAISATLLAGDYVAVHTYGWTEFDIAPETQVLTVTTYGVPPYTAQELMTNPISVTTQTPTIVSQFRVVPQALVRKYYLPIVAK